MKWYPLIQLTRHRIIAAPAPAQFFGKFPRKPGKNPAMDAVLGKKAAKTAEIVEVLIDTPCPSHYFPSYGCTGFPLFSRGDNMAKSGKKSITKAEVYDSMAQEMGTTKAEVKKFFVALENLLVRHL